MSNPTGGLMEDAIKRVCRIAGVNVLVTAHYERLREQIQHYIVSDVDESSIAFAIEQTNDDIDRVCMKRFGQIPTTHSARSTYEYMLSGTQFHANMLNYNAFMLHSSAVACDSKAYLFTADSGTGKSTHTGLWLKHFGSERAFIVNDDKPIVRKIDETYYVCGTPWSGKNNIQRNTMVPLQAIAYVVRNPENSIERMEPKDALPLLFEQTVYRVNENLMSLLLDRLDDLLRTVPVYRLRCNISDEAVCVAHGAMSGGI